MKLSRTIIDSGSLVNTAYGFSCLMYRTTSPSSLAAVRQLPVLVAQEEHVLHAQDLRRGALLLLTDRRQLLRRHVRVVAALVAVGQDQVVELPALLATRARRCRRSRTRCRRGGPRSPAHVEVDRSGTSDAPSSLEERRPTRILGSATHSLAMIESAAQGLDKRSTTVLASLTEQAFVRNAESDWR